MRPFRVVVAGRPNVGKSAIFNRLIRRRQSLVHDLPGVTRDLIEADGRLSDGRRFRVVDTGGYEPEGREDIPRAVREKALGAIREADLVLLVIDASAGILPADRGFAAVVRQAGAPVAVVANKIDRKEGREGEVEAWNLGFNEVYGVSAEHGEGFDDLLDAIGARMPAAAGDEAGETDDEESDTSRREIAVAIVGRPNVGKSSLSNALLGRERSIVAAVAGTTRDSVDAYLHHGGRAFRLVDTAGIRRKGKTERGPEVLSVVQARKRIEDCDLALLIVDAAEGPTAQDATVASYVNDAGKGLVLVANKWDLAGGEAAAQQLQETLAEKVPFARHAPVLRVSAKTGRGVSKILAVAAQVAENRRRRVSTGELNRVLGRSLRDSPPRTAGGRRLRVYYVAQTGTAPPTFTIVANREERLHFSEERRIENLIRGTADFSGSPLRLSVRSRSREEAKERRSSRK
ncbi:MAG TPA: ribosome biogenesis GTPase Der [Thermoanaerobaculia bacterium]